MEVGSAKLISVRSEWPDDLRWVFDLFFTSTYAEGVKALYTPRFIAATREPSKLLYTSWGNEGWTRHFKPWLDKRVP